MYTLCWTHNWKVQGFIRRPWRLIFALGFQVTRFSDMKENNPTSPFSTRQYWQRNFRIILIFSCLDLLELEKALSAQIQAMKGKMVISLPFENGKIIWEWMKHARIYKNRLILEIIIQNISSCVSDCSLLVKYLEVYVFADFMGILITLNYSRKQKAESGAKTDSTAQDENQEANILQYSKVINFPFLIESWKCRAHPVGDQAPSVQKSFWRSHFHARGQQNGLAVDEVFFLFFSFFCTFFHFLLRCMRQHWAWVSVPESSK